MFVVKGIRTLTLPDLTQARKNMLLRSFTGDGMGILAKYLQLTIWGTEEFSKSQ